MAWLNEDDMGSLATQISNEKVQVVDPSQFLVMRELIWCVRHQ